MKIAENPMYKSYLQDGINKIAVEVAPKIGVAMGVKGVEELVSQIEEITEMFKLSLKEAMITDWRSYGWKI